MTELATLEITRRVSLLKRNIFFQNVDDETLANIVPRFVLREYKRRDYIWIQGDPSDVFGIIRDGYVKIIKHSEGGKDILLELLGPGDVIGAVALLEGRPYPATARALDDAMLLTLSRAEFLDIIAHSTAVATQALVAIGSRLRHAHEMVRQLAVECVESRIANVLLMLASRSTSDLSDRTIIRARLTRRDIAEMVGTALETAIRILSRWEKSGIVGRERGHLVLFDVAALQKLSSEQMNS